jgi:FKBP-type peptidyl-prolyl cis-trans isomerase (trigger factor)
MCQIYEPIDGAEIEQKLQAVVAREKLRCVRDPVYLVLADVIALLESAYEAAGVKRSKAQIHAEALDAFLSSVSKDAGEANREALLTLITQNVTRYRNAGDVFFAEMEKLIDKRRAITSAMSLEERAEEAFGAYLASLGFTEEQWKHEVQRTALKEIMRERELDGFAANHGIAAEDAEIESAYTQIAGECGVSEDEVRAALPAEAISTRIRREKAEILLRKRS